MTAGRRAALLAAVAAGVLVFAAPVPARAQNPAIVLASTTSTQQSGLLAHLLPQFTQATGISVKVVAVGSGQAIDMARRGDADILLAHDPPAEEQLVAEGFALARRPVMHNDFVLIGPAADPARLRGRDLARALATLQSGGHGFVSRGDRSGTHAAELRAWKLAGIQAPSFPGYRACGCGMGQALQMAATLDAYVLSDRGTWLAFAGRAGQAVLVEGDARLVNPYSVLEINPARHPHVKTAPARAFASWLTGPAGQAAIAGFRIAGEPPFVPHERRP